MGVTAVETRAGRELAEEARSFVEGGRTRGAWPTGIGSLDQALGGGLIPGHLAVIAGRPAMGCTTMALNLVDHALRAGRGALVVSTSSPRGAVAADLVALRAGVSRDELLAGRWSEACEAEADALASAPLRIAEAYGSDADAIARWVRRTAADVPRPELVVVDGLSSILDPKDAPWVLRGLARDLQLPVVLTARVKRTVERRPYLVPSPTDVRHSRSVLLAAGVMLLLYRDGYYFRHAPQDTLEVGVSRDGFTTTVNLGFDGPTGRVWELPEP